MMEDGLRRASQNRFISRNFLVSSAASRQQYLLSFEKFNGYLTRQLKIYPNRATRACTQSAPGEQRSLSCASRCLELLFPRPLFFKRTAGEAGYSLSTARIDAGNVTIQFVQAELNFAVHSSVHPEYSNLQLQRTMISPRVASLFGAVA